MKIENVISAIVILVAFAALVAGAKPIAHVIPGATIAVLLIIGLARFFSKKRARTTQSQPVTTQQPIKGNQRRKMQDELNRVTRDTKTTSSYRQVYDGTGPEATVERPDGSVVRVTDCVLV